MSMSDIKDDKRWSDIHYVWNKIKENPSFYLYADEKIKQNKDIILYVTLEKASLTKEIPKDFFKNDNNIMELLKNNVFTFQYLEDIYKGNIEFAKYAIEKKVNLFYYLNNTLRKDKEIILLASRENPSILLEISDYLSKDKKICEKIIENNPKSYPYLPVNIKKNYDLSYYVVKNLPHYIMYLVDHKEKKEILYLAKDIILKDKILYSNEYSLLLKYEKEDNLRNNIKNKEDTLKKIKL